ncbi:hypothetical protein PENSPDRAFT_682466 [Peniophora sp. CONT]|nr:hypothetical protein PENSPDRAFT_682466 [Peniophora sp. CONT]
MSINSTRFAWDSMPVIQTCTMQTLNWSHQGNRTVYGTVNISITNIDVEQQAPMMSSTTTTTPATDGTSTATLLIPASSIDFHSAGSSRRKALESSAPARFPHTMHQRQGSDDYNGYGGTWLPRIDQTLALNVLAHDHTWTWLSVNVTQGWYVLVADVTGGDTIRNTSSPFFVRNGTTSCFAAVASPHPSSPFTLRIPSSSTTVAPDVVSSGTAISIPVHSHPHRPGAIAGGAAGGVVLVVGILVAAVVRLRRRRSSSFAHTVNDPVTAAGVPDPYDATVEQFPIQRRTTFLPLAGAPNPYVTKELRQPLRHGPRAEDVGLQAVRPPLPLADAEAPREQLDEQTEQEITEMISVSTRVLQRLLQRVGGVWPDFQHGEDGSADDRESSTAPPEYEEVVGS